jgi:hypothetical protein
MFPAQQHIYKGVFLKELCLFDLAQFWSLTNDMAAAPDSKTSWRYARQILRNLTTAKWLPRWRIKKIYPLMLAKMGVVDPAPDGSTPAKPALPTKEEASANFERMRNQVFEACEWIGVRMGVMPNTVARETTIDQMNSIRFAIEKRDLEIQRRDAISSQGDLKELAKSLDTSIKMIDAQKKRAMQPELAKRDKVIAIEQIRRAKEQAAQLAGAFG